MTCPKQVNFYITTFQEAASFLEGDYDPADDVRDASELPKLTQRLLSEGYAPEVITKILGGNALRVLREGWGKHD